jgi:hypothetical protein
VASLQELLKYLEQFMHGNLNQHPSPSGGGAPPGGMPPGGAPHEPMPGGMPGGAPPPGGMPPGGMPPGGMPPGTMPPGAGALPPELANASPQQVQEAMQQFATLHPELAPYLQNAAASGSGSLDLAGLTSQLAAVPPQVLQQFVPAGTEPGQPDAAPATGEFGDWGDLGAPLTSEFANLPSFDDGGGLSGFNDLLGGVTGNAFPDTPSILTDPSAGAFSQPAATLTGGYDDDYSAMVDGLAGVPPEVPVISDDFNAGFDPSFLADLNQPGVDSFDTGFDTGFNSPDEAVAAFGSDASESAYDDITNTVPDPYDQ